MSVNVYDKTNDKLKLIAGGLLYADAPVGSIQAYGGTTAPSGWLLCQGQAVSRTTYSELFAVIGTAYGSGNGSSTFNLPTLTQCKQDYSVKTQIDTWRNSLEDGSESHTFTIDKDGSYYFEVVLANSTGGKESNNITITSGNNNLVCSWGFVGSNAVLQNKTIFLRAGTYVITHICQTSGIGGTAVVTIYSTGNAPVGSYIIKAKHASVPTDFTDSLIGYLGKETNYNLYPWSHIKSNEGEDISQDITIERDGWYSIDYTLSSNADTNHTFTLRDFDSLGEVHTIMRTHYDKSGTFRQTYLIPLKAGTYRYSHGGIGTLSVYMNRRDFA